MDTTCPSCGAPLKFRASHTVSQVCTFCKSLVVRRDVNLEALGKVADVPQDMSPLQLGSQGKNLKGKTFEVVGRLKRGWSEGYWNEWYVLYANGDAGWLAEAQGFWMLFEQVELKHPFPRLDQLKLFMRVEMDRIAPDADYAGGRTFQVTDIKRAKVLAMEGELPRFVQVGAQSYCVDLNAAEGGTATFEYPDDGLPMLFLGHFLTADQLNFTYLRELDGWKL